MKMALAPHKVDPPENSVGLVMMMNQDMRRFKFAFHSVISFADHPYMLTLIENMSPFSTRNYLRALQKNYPLNVLSYQEPHNFAGEINLGMRYMFTNPTVKFGCFFTANVLVENEWLNDSVTRMIADPKLGILFARVLCNCNGDAPNMVFFRRSAYEQAGGYSSDFFERIKMADWKIEEAPNALIHKMTGRTK